MFINKLFNYYKIWIYQVLDWSRGRLGLAERCYNTYSDIIFGWVAWICLSISDFFAEFLTLFSRWVVKLKNHTEFQRRALGAPLRPPIVASLLSTASAPPLGPDGAPPCDFSILPPIVKKSQDISKKVRDISQVHAISQKNVAICIL